VDTSVSDTKICSKCGELKSTKEFYKRNKGFYLTSWCKSCYADYPNTWSEEQKKSRRQSKRNRDLRRHHGITLSEYETMLTVQKGCCAICGNAIKLGQRKLAVDHDHETGKTRGLLCVLCNIGLGFYERMLPQMLKYIQNQGD